MKKRFEMWCGTGWPKGWVKAFNLKIPEDECVVVWPIVDTETCGNIDGFPKPEQWYCIAFTSESQLEICNLLNKK